MDSSSSPQRRQHRASAMDARAAAPFMALERRLAFPGFPVRADRARPTLAPGKEWARIDCSGKKAHGCGNHGEKQLLEGITLYARTDHPYLTTTLSVFLSEDVRRSLEANLNVGGAVCAEGAVKVAAEQLLVLLVAFSNPPHSPRRAYYLVYDATDASLYMIPFLPPHIVCVYTSTPVVVPRFTGGDGGRDHDHELVLLARKFFPASPGCLVCLCSPATSASASDDEGSNEFEFESRSTGVWQVKLRHFPEVPYAFWPEQMFCLKGKLCWADIAQGLVCCDADDLRAGDADAFAKFHFVSLPRGYLVRDLTESQAKRRTIACVGSTVYFVYIDHGRRHRRPGDEMVVKVWTLDMDRGTWSYHRGFPCPWKEMWRQVYFMDDAGTRDVDVEPQYLVLMPGGGLCLYLHLHHQERRRTRESDYICCFDMHSKRSLWFGPVRDHNSASFILPANFFVRNCLPPSTRAHNKRKNVPRHASLELGTRVIPAVSHDSGR